MLEAIDHPRNLCVFEGRQGGFQDRLLRSHETNRQWVGDKGSDEMDGMEKIDQMDKMNHLGDRQ
jgi:hypothetical protein